MEITKILPFPQYSLMTDTFSQCEINFEEQECIPVGCVPAAHRPYAAVFFRGGFLPGRGGLPGPGGAVCLVLGGGAVCLVWGALLGPGAFSLVRGVCLVQGGSPCRGGLPGGSPQTLPCTESQTCVKT